MIPTYFIEDLTIEDLDALIERGACFDVVSKNAVLPENRGELRRDNVRGGRDELPNVIRHAD